MITDKPIVELLQQLIGLASVSPEDNHCQDILIKRLKQLDFHCESIPSGPVSNLYAHRGEKTPRFAFAGHTDVVPAGDAKQWDSPPFQAQIRDGKVYGRGSTDMKGSLAAMIIACEHFIGQYPHHAGSIAFLITSGEEGDEFDHGTPILMQYLENNHAIPQWCVVGEPSSTAQTGDVVKVGRRGSFTAKLVIHGKQGHVAYPHLAINPIHQCAEFVDTLVKTQWDSGNAFFPPTTLQITDIHAGIGVGNLIPGDCALQFNFRYSTETNDQQIKVRVEQLLNQYKLNYEIHWRLNGKPFLTNQGILIDAVQTVIENKLGHKPELSTAGGTSDGRFIAPYGVEVIELGPPNHTAHQINEYVAIDDLTVLAELYYRLLERLLVNE